MKHKLEDIKWEIMQICKQTKLYCESYIEKVKYFENFNFSDL